MKTITIFTPTYNRAETLYRTYKSLCRQTSKDFEWLIVDDGSLDNTRDIVKTWIAEKKIPIRYIYKQNGGLHTGYNTAIMNIDTELCVCCDSDDFLPNNAIEIILNTWKTKGNINLAGIIGLDFDMATGLPIGGYFPEAERPYHFLEIQEKLNHYGDTKMVLRTSLLKPHVPMPSFQGEKNFNPIYIFMKIPPEFKYIIINENLCNVDYQPSGMSANIFNQFRNSPRSFAEIRKVKLTHPCVSAKRKFIDAAHLVSSAMIAKDLSILVSSPRKWLTLSACPAGFILYLYIMYKSRRHK